MTLLLCLMLLVPPQDGGRLSVGTQASEIWFSLDSLGRVSYINPKLLGFKSSKEATQYFSASLFWGALLSDWDNYKAECWNDSTLTTQEVIPVKKNGKWEWSIGRAYYSHGHYPSFDGFMEYLKRKYKGE